MEAMNEHKNTKQVKNLFRSQKKRKITYPGLVVRITFRLTILLKNKIKDTRFMIFSYLYSDANHRKLCGGLSGGLKVWSVCNCMSISV